jgi:hypothetical protein
MRQDWLSYLTVIRFGINTEQMPTKFVTITEVAKILISTLSELVFAHSYWTFAWCQNQKKVFSSSNYQQVGFAESAPAQFANGGDR